MSRTVFLGFTLLPFVIHYCFIGGRGTASGIVAAGRALRGCLKIPPLRGGRGVFGWSPTLDTPLYPPSKGEFYGCRHRQMYFQTASKAHGNESSPKMETDSVLKTESVWMSRISIFCLRPKWKVGCCGDGVGAMGNGGRLMNSIKKTDLAGCCQICGGVAIFVTCLGCGIEMCEGCARFELIGSGCGCVWPAYYCAACARNPFINPNAILRDPEG